MKKLIKLLILILLNISVYFIYNNTKNSTYRILILGDNLSLANKQTYIDYYKTYKLKKYHQVYLNKSYSKKDLSVSNLRKDIQANKTIKRDLISTNILIINVGYNDLVYKISLLEDKNPNKLATILNEIRNDYLSLIKEIKKYYHKDIIVIGYYPSLKDDYYLNKGITYLNKILREPTKVIYIDTYNDLNNNKYFSNPNTYFPNTLGHQVISKKLIKTLENNKNIWYINKAIYIYGKLFVMAEGEIIWKREYIQK